MPVPGLRKNVQDQADFLLAAGVHAIQGYYYSRPVNPDQVAPLLRGEDASASVQTGNGR